MSPTVSVKVWAPYACFTRPELKVERLSYPVVTPSGARGVLEAILWRPQMRWHVRRITVLRPWLPPVPPDGMPYWLVGVRRNEIQGKIAPLAVKRWIADAATFEPYLVDSAGREGAGGQSRTQRNTLALRNVAYLIEASVFLTPQANQQRSARRKPRRAPWAGHGGQVCRDVSAARREGAVFSPAISRMSRVRLRLWAKRW